MITLTSRSDFLAAARGSKCGTKGLFLQAHFRGDEAEEWRVGYTCSKKVGNAVARNHAKRRLREVARAVLTTEAQAGWNYVLIGKADATEQRDFQDLIGDLRYALSKVHP